MTYDLEAFVQSLGIDTKAAGVDVGYNDFNVDCPFCGYDKHLGIHRLTGQINCWVCGFDGVKPRPTLLTLVMQWADVPKPVARSMLRRARGSAQAKPPMPHSVQVVWPERSILFDSSVAAPYRHDRDIAYTYLKARGFTTGDIRHHGLLFTPRRHHRDPNSERAHEDYWGRVIFPITLGNLTVNWVGRDYTGAQKKLKYKNAMTTMSVVQISSLLWGMDDFVKSGERHLRVCEGIFDAHTLGQVGVSVQKSKLSGQQLTLIRRAKPEAVSIIFDPATNVDRYVKSRALAAAQDVSAYVRRIKLVELVGGDIAELGATATFKAEEEATWLAI